jgi:hypothetical protein
VTRAVRAGDQVRLLELPEWLLHDLPESEKVEMRAFVGKTTVVTEVDAYGYCWIGFGVTEDSGDLSQYCGHSFCVPQACLDLTDIQSP